MSMGRIVVGLAIAWAVTLSPLCNAHAECTPEAYALAQQSIPYLEKQQWDQAARLLYRAAQLSPGDFSVQYNLGLSFQGLKRYREAWQCFAKATKINPADADAALALAIAYGQCGDKKRSATMLRDCQRRFQLDSSQQSQLAAALVEYDAGASQTQSLTKLTSSQPQNTQMHSTLAYSLLKAEKYKEALAEYQTCCRLDPNDPHNYQNLMYCQNKIGDLEGLQDTRKTFVKKFPSDPQTKSILEAIDYYEKDFASVRSREAQQRNNPSAASTASGYAPFVQMRMPLKVYVHDRLAGRTTWSAKQSPNAKAKVNYSLMVERAFDAWSSASGKRLTFIVIDSPDNANIECEWTPDKNKLHYAFAGGVTKFTTNKSGEPKATIFLLSECKDENEFFDTSLHEIGHAIGLEHSSNPADIMYFSGQNVAGKSTPTLSANDVSRLKSLYK